MKTLLILTVASLFALTRSYPLDSSDHSPDQNEDGTIQIIMRKSSAKDLAKKGLDFANQLGNQALEAGKELGKRGLDAGKTALDFGKQMGDTLLSMRRKAKQQHDIVQRRRTIPITETHDDGEDQEE